MPLILLASAGLPADAAARDLPAVLDWSDTYIVSFPVDGRVSQVRVRVGERVAGGARLVELDTEPFKIQLRRLDAAVAAREPVLADEAREYEQAKSLYEQTVLSDVELQRARNAYEKARAELAESTAQRELARWRLDRAGAVAPWDARVIRRSVEPGQMVVDEQRSIPLLVLAKTDAMTAGASLPAAAMRALHIGQQVRVLIDDDSRDAEIISLGMQPETDRGEPGYRLEARFSTTQDDDFRAGQAAVIRLP